MEKEFIPYEQAVALKELGFDEKCLSCYLYEVETFSWELNYQISNNSIPWIISAPLYQQAFRWFREKHKLDSYHIEPTKDSHGDRCYGVMGLRTAIFNGRFDSYEEAEVECLKKLIQITNEKI
jgi:hypothetical protein